MNTKYTDKHILKIKAIWKSNNQVAESPKKIKKKQSFGTQQINQEKNYIHYKLVESSLVAYIH